MTKDRTSNVACADSGGASIMDLSGLCVGNSYLLECPIGQGATGTVWRGVERASGTPVAVKLLHESLLRQPKLVTRFVQERTILLMLRHPNVVRVRDLFGVAETLGLVMDLVDGGSLRDHLREHHTVPAGEAARLAAQVAAALAEAHELGIIHRDLKPDNVLLRIEDGRPDTRLTDFGVARILNTPSMTTSDAVMGTPHYMAPEAFHGVTASAATDVYALGVLLYELVSGRPPYDSDAIPDLMRRHLAGNPERRPGIPEGIWELITQCMAIKPSLRPAAAEMAAELSAAAQEFVDVPALARPESAAAAGPEVVRLPPLPRKREPGPLSRAVRDGAAHRRWARHGATVTTGIAAMLATVAAVGLHHRSTGGDTAGPAHPAIMVAPTVSERLDRPTTRDVGPRRDAVPKHFPSRAPRATPTGVARAVTSPRVPVKSPARWVTRTRSPQPEAESYGAWQCTPSIVFDFDSRLDVAPKPCQMLGRDIQYQASLTAPGGGAGSITVALQDAGSGRTVAGPKTCEYPAFRWSEWRWGCRPVGASPARGRRYMVSMWFRYVREGRMVSRTTRGGTFTW